ncbi:MAG: ATP-grasp domain-containing protein [Anaerolineales bacterium]|jgi:carbamoyl-phosphate synthase large subunit
MTTKTSTVNLLFTSAGRRVELMRLYQRARTGLKLDGRTIVTDIDPLAPANQVADEHVLVPRCNDPDYLPALAEICRRESVDLVFPLIDPDIPVLAHGRKTLEETGATVVVLPAQSVDQTVDKWLTYQFFRSIDIPTPQTWLPDEINPKQAEYPLFVKPRFGSAARHTYKVANPVELAFFMDYVPHPIIQGYLPGEEITNDVICSLKGKLWAVVSRQRIEVRWGEVAKGVTILDRDIQAHCRTIAKALEAVGPITVQCILKDGQPYFTEINARYGGGHPLAIAAGIDTPSWYLSQAAGMEIEIPALDQYQTGLYLTRFDDSFFLAQDDFD